MNLARLDGGIVITGTKDELKNLSDMILFKIKYGDDCSVVYRKDCVIRIEENKSPIKVSEFT